VFVPCCRLEIPCYRLSIPINLQSSTPQYTSLVYIAHTPLYCYTRPHQTENWRSRPISHTHKRSRHHLVVGVGDHQRIPDGCVFPLCSGLSAFWSDSSTWVVISHAMIQVVFFGDPRSWFSTWRHCREYLFFGLQLLEVRFGEASRNAHHASLFTYQGFRRPSRRAPCLAWERCSVRNFRVSRHSCFGMHGTASIIAVSTSSLSEPLCCVSAFQLDF